MMKTTWFLGLALFFSTAAYGDNSPAVGQPAPSFVAPASDGTQFDLQKRKGQWTVLYFYPKDNTPGCTKEACAFRDNIERIRKAGAEVYGISRDSVERHKKFIAEHHLTFVLLSDEDGKISKAFGVSGFLGMAKRWTFVIGPKLELSAVEKDVDPALNPEQVLAELKRSAATNPSLP